MRVGLKSISHFKVQKFGKNLKYFTLFVVQIEAKGKLSDSLLVSTTLMLVYITKFFWWESGYWNTLDIAHDRGE